MSTVNANSLSKKRNEINATGFGQFNAKRLINKDGSANVKLKGVKFWEGFSSYHYFTSITKTKFLLFTFTLYFFVNIVFAFIYVGIGLNQLQGSIASQGNSSLLQDFTDAFFFSAQTYSTVGYGRLAPVGIVFSVVAAVESLLGLLSFALITGLVYGRFSMPTTKLVISNQMVLTPYLEGEGLMFRFANARKENLIDAEMNIIFAFVKEQNGKMVRQFINAELERNKIALLSQSWTVVHPINNISILLNKNEIDLKDMDLEVLVFFKAYDEKYNQTVHQRFSYKYNEIVFNKKFASIVSVNKQGEIEIELNRIGEMTTLN